MQKVRIRCPNEHQGRETRVKVRRPRDGNRRENESKTEQGTKRQQSRQERQRDNKLTTQTKGSHDDGHGYWKAPGTAAANCGQELQTREVLGRKNVATTHGTRQQNKSHPENRSSDGAVKTAQGWTQN
jgi:hypothetical protein